MENILKIKDKVKHNSIFSGTDSPTDCFNKEHFFNYKKKINYQYNSKGFRDIEWPDNLNDVIWCVGDSFTVGVGQPFEETWPQLLEKKTGKRCINVGVDGCSNDTMCLRIKEIYGLYKPKLIVVMWSYLSRRRINNEDVHHNKKDFGRIEDLKNFNKNFIEVNNLNCKIINLLIPNALESQRTIKDMETLKYLLLKTNFEFDDIKKINCVPQLDYARDYLHFDVKTSEHLVDLLTKKINDFDK